MYYLITSSTRYVIENNCLLFLFVLFFLSIVVGEIGIQLKLQPVIPMILPQGLRLIMKWRFRKLCKIFFFFFPFIFCKYDVQERRVIICFFLKE
jgi:hypothetical protein